MTKKEALRYYLAGFVCGEGCFFKTKRKNRPNSYTFVFSLSQNKRDKKLVKLLKKELGCGRIIFNKCNNSYRYDCDNQKDLIGKIIPYFDGYLKGYKKRQFDKWRAELIPYHKSIDRRRSESAKKRTDLGRDKLGRFISKNNLTLPLHT